MTEHILLENANRYVAPALTPLPDNHLYDKKRGYWIHNSTGEAMMLSDDPQKPQSKKCDIETGEDQKGE